METGKYRDLTCFTQQNNRGHTNISVWLFAGDFFVRRHPRFSADTENLRQLIESIFPDEQLITEISHGEWTSLNLIKTH